MTNVRSPSLPWNSLKTPRQSRRRRTDQICSSERRSKLSTETRDADDEPPPFPHASPRSFDPFPVESLNQVGSDVSRPPSDTLGTYHVLPYPPARHLSNCQDTEAWAHQIPQLSSFPPTRIQNICSDANDADRQRLRPHTRLVKSLDLISAENSSLDSANHGQVYSENGSGLPHNLAHPGVQHQPRLSVQSPCNTPGMHYQGYYQHWANESLFAGPYPSAGDLLEPGISPLFNPMDTPSTSTLNHQPERHHESISLGSSRDHHDQAGPYAPENQVCAYYSYDNTPTPVLTEHSAFSLPEDTESHHYHSQQATDVHPTIHQPPHGSCWPTSDSATMLPIPTRSKRQAQDGWSVKPTRTSLSSVNETSSAIGGESRDSYVQKYVCSQPYEECDYMLPGLDPSRGLVDGSTPPLNPDTGSAITLQDDPATPTIGEKRSNKSKAQRRPFGEEKKKATAETRKRRACIRCRNQKKRCELDPNNPNACCMKCCNVDQNSKRTIRPAGLHYSLLDVQLARQGSLGFTKRWEGTSMQDVDLPSSSDRRFIEFKIFYTHNPSYPELYHEGIRLEVRKFVPIEGDVVDRKWTWNGRGMVTSLAPYALHSIHDSAKAILRYIEEHAFNAITTCVASSEPVIRCTYQMAIDHWRSLNPSDLATQAERRFLSRLFKVWFAMRLTTGSAYLSGDEKLDMKPEMRPGYPLGNRISLPRMVTAQIDSILTTTILEDETKMLRKEMNGLFSSSSPKHWFTLYIATFILLHEISVATQDRERYARQNQLPTRFSLPSLVAAQHMSATSLLAHWSYYKSENNPGNTHIDNTDKSPMRFLNQNQKEFVWYWWSWMTTPEAMRQNCPDDPRQQEAQLAEPLYFVSQMFIGHWSPRTVFRDHK